MSRWPHTSTSLPPRPLSQSQPTATPPHAPTLSTTGPCHQQCDMSHRHHRGVMWPIDDNDSSPAPSRATRTAPCHVLLPPPLRATTISLTAGHCPLRAATAIYVPLLPHSRCPHLLPFATMHLTPVPPHFGPTTVYPHALALGWPPPPTHFPHARTPHISCMWFAHCVRCLADCTHSIDWDCEWLDFCGDS